MKLFPLIFSKKIIIETIQVENAHITLCRQHPEKKEPTPTEESLWKSIKPHINGIYVNSILLDKIKLTYRHSENKKDISFSYNDCSVKLRHIRIDSIGAANPSRILFTEEVVIKLLSRKYFTPDSLYNLKVDTLNYSSFSKKVKLYNFSYKPTLSPIEFTRKRGMQVDIFETEILQVIGINFKIERFFIDNEVCLDTIILQKRIIKIHRDRTAHYHTTSQLGKYANEALAKAPFKKGIKFCFYTICQY